MKQSFFIMHVFKRGNIFDDLLLEKLKEQEKEGYISPEKAHWAMIDLKEKGNLALNQKGNTFTILPLWIIE